MEILKNSKKGGGSKHFISGVVNPKGGGDILGGGDCIFQPKFQNSVIVSFQNTSNIKK